MEGLLPYLVAFNLLWFSALVFASILHRRAKGRPVLSWNVPGARYFERFASGSSHKSGMAKLGGAHNCLIVAVTSDRFIARPFFPFTLMFLPEIFRLDVDVPLTHVERAELVEASLGDRLNIWFRDTHGEPQQLTIRTKKPEALLSLLPTEGRDPQKV